ncbi:CRISPR-associated endoribonuclease Cas2 [wastewater metagenome]|uniref:CRISPR-associated endoribonuclease Cas2 n=2 Tax=unclassified sequences TaxID=12908 RepID=A0A5B8RGR8_9ZZZZ|nr:CRISPR-associated endonuclease Cas2 [Arhodomonas sp. KWT]QEA07078.1 CRISPR-associated endoribonuclease Cas2 [uncultured organism]
MHRKLFLAAYDVRDPKRLAKAVRVVRGYASGGQKSAYECWLTPQERKGLHSEMAAVLDLSEDVFAVIPLEPGKPLATLGQAVRPVDPDFFYFG